MNKYLLTLLMSCFITSSQIQGDGIRLYQESDHEILREMLSNNEDLLFPEDNLEMQVLATAKFFSFPLNPSTYVSIPFGAFVCHELQWIETNKSASTLFAISPLSHRFTKTSVFRVYTTLILEFFPIIHLLQVPI